MTLLFTSTFTVFYRGILVFFLCSCSLCFSDTKCGQIFISFKRHPKARWSAEVEEAVSERHKAFAAAHRSDEDRQGYISASRHVSSSVIAKSKAEAWQATCSSLSPKSVCSLLHCVAASFSSPSFPNYSSSRESALVLADYLRFHFSVSQPKALHSRVRGYLSVLRRATCPEEFPFAFPSPPLNFLWLSQTSSCPLPLAQTKSPIPC